MCAQQILSTNTFTTAKFIVSATSSDGTHTTIASALTSASSGDTIFIRPGTYTENLTLKAGVNLCAFDCDSETPNVIILGKATMTAAGTCTISGLQLKTNSDFFLAVTGSAASIVILKDCYLNFNNNTGISHTSSSPTSKIRMLQCQGDIATTGIALFTSTSAGGIDIIKTVITNSGNSTTASTISTGGLLLRFAEINSPVTTSSVGSVDGNHSVIQTTGINTTALTTAGTGISSFHLCYFGGGTATSISVGSGTTVALTLCDINSSNTSAISGAGAVTIAGLTFSGTSLLVGAGLTQTNQNIPNFATKKIIWIHEDWINNNVAGSLNWRQQGGGTATVAINESAYTSATAPGVLALHTGTGAGGNAAIELGSDNVNCITFGGADWTIGWIAKIPVLSSGATNRFTVYLGFGNTSGGPNTGVYFSYVDNVNSGNWVLNANDNSSLTSTNSTSAADTNYHIYTINVNAAANLATFYIDGISVGTVTTNIPTTHFCGPVAAVQNNSNAGATDRAVVLDAFELYGIMTTVR